MFCNKAWSSPLSLMSTSTFSLRQAVLALLSLQNTPVTSPPLQIRGRGVGCEVWGMLRLRILQGFLSPVLSSVPARGAACCVITPLLSGINVLQWNETIYNGKKSDSEYFPRKSQWKSHPRKRTLGNLTCKTSMQIPSRKTSSGKSNLRFPGKILELFSAHNTYFSTVIFAKNWPLNLAIISDKSVTESPCSEATLTCMKHVTELYQSQSEAWKSPSDQWEDRKTGEIKL